MSLRNRIVDALREEILTNRLKPGTVLLERECASRFGVSKTPVREALSLLVHEGLVELLPRKGYLVSSITVRDAQDDFELRVILEGAAAESELITHRYALEEANEAFRALAAGEVARGLIVF